MNTRLVMSVTAIVLGVVGIACLFFPEDILELYSPSALNTNKLLVQLIGASFFGFAALDWVSREALLGGIYGRPVVGANYAHFFIGSLLIVRTAISEPGNVVVWFTLAAYALFATAFGVIFFGPPPQKRSLPSS